MFTQFGGNVVAVRGKKLSTASKVARNSRPAGSVNDWCEHGDFLIEADKKSAKQSTFSVRAYDINGNTVMLPTNKTDFSDIETGYAAVKQELDKAYGT